MLCLNKGKLSTRTLVELILLSAFLLIVVILFISVKTQFSPEFLKQYACWANNAMKATSSVFRYFLPEECPMQEKMDVTLEELASMIRSVWWMYGRGKWDLAWRGGVDGLYVHYIFYPKEDIKISDLVVYLKTHSNGEIVDVTDPESDWNYLQAGSVGTTLCIDKKTIGNELKKGERYFIIFYDSRGMVFDSKEDRVAISKNINFGQGFIQRIIRIFDDGCKEIIFYQK